MDSQRSLFKKFFGNNNNKAQETNGNNNDNSGNRGFNPPKFQFDKKKLGIMSNARATEPVEPTIDTNEHIGISDSEFGDNHIDDWMDTDTSFNDIMNTTKMVEPPKEANTSTHNTNTEIQNNKNTSTVSDAIHNNPNDNALYNGILQKNHQKYNLSNQLESFNEDIEVFQRNCEGKRNKMELLLLSLDEKLAEVNNFNLSILLN